MKLFNMIWTSYCCEQNRSVQRSKIKTNTQERTYFQFGVGAASLCAGAADGALDAESAHPSVITPPPPTPTRVTAWEIMELMTRKTSNNTHDN
jgi:hypothetical protein